MALSSFGFAEAQSPDRGLLWRVVQLCAANARLTGGSFPCLDVSLAGGFAVVRAPLDTTHVVVVPTVRLPGIEAASLQASDSANYFADAWGARHFVEDRAPRRLERSDIGLAINSLPGRSQDQLHIHVDCLARTAREALKTHAADIGSTWSRLRFELHGERYWALRVASADLAGVNVFRLAAEGLHVTEADLARMTIVVAGTRSDQGRDGFYLLATLATSSRRMDGHGEFLLDNSCTGR